MNNKIAFIFCLEKGLLEEQTKLLVNSFQKFIKSKDIKLIAFSPRKDNFPSAQIENFLLKNNVLHIKKNINVDYLDYPIANKVLACEYVERQFQEYEKIVFLDTDTVFLNHFHHNYISKNNKLYLRPVDNKGPGSFGENDINDVFWKEVYKMFNLSLPEAKLTTTVRPCKIRPYYNAGLIWANGIPGFFKQWKMDFTKLVESGLRPFGYQSRDNTDFRCLDQVSLAVTAQRYNKNIEILPQLYNYPIPFRPALKDRPNHPKFNNLVHVHYHKWFQHPGFLDHVTNKDEKISDQYLWLKEHLPLSPKIDGKFKC